MENQEAHILAQGSGAGQWLMLGCSALLLLVGFPIWFFSDNLAFGLCWTFIILAINAPLWIWPKYTACITPAGFSLESPLRKSAFYPTNEFVEVSISNDSKAATASTYLTFKDGRQYRVVLKMGLRKAVQPIFTDGAPFTETKTAANKHVRDAIAAYRATQIHS